MHRARIIGNSDLKVKFHTSIKFRNEVCMEVEGNIKLLKFRRWKCILSSVTDIICFHILVFSYVFQQNNFCSELQIGNF